MILITINTCNKFILYYLNFKFLYYIFRRSLNKSVVNRRDVKQQLDDLEDHRPFFTYWVTVVQILVLFLSIFSYGLGPFGIDLSHQSGAVSIILRFFLLYSL